MFTYPVFHGGPGASAFDALVASFSPRVYYGFQDADFSSQITDLSGNAYHCLKASTPAASVITAFRPGTRAQAARFPDTNGTVASQAAFDAATASYATSGTGVSTAFSGAAKAMVQMSFKIDAETTPSSIMVMCGVTNRHAAINSYLNKLTFEITGGVQYIRNWWRDFGTQDEAANYDDNAIHIVTCRWEIAQATDRKMWIDGVEVDTGAAGSSMQTGTYPFIINGTTNSAWISYGFDTDHISAWAGTMPTDAQVLDMHAAYLAEL